MDKDAFGTVQDVAGLRCKIGLDSSHATLNLLLNSVAGDRLKVFYTGSGMPIGYVAWVNLNKEGFKMTARRGCLPIYPYEWNEGKLTVVYDVLFLDRWGYLARDMLLDVLASKRFVSFIKKDRLKVIKRKKRLLGFVGRKVLGK